MRALPSLRQLRYLVVLSELRNFTRAAEACFVTQSTLSAGLKELETTLGAQLVERDRQSVRMTAVGEATATRARELLAAAGDLTESAAAAAAPVTGTVRLGVIPTVAPFFLPQLLPQMRQQHPRLRLALREDLTANLITRLTDGDLDFTVIALPYDTTNLLVQPLFDDELWLVMHSEDALAAQARVTLDEEILERLLLLEEGHCLRDHTLQACGPARAAGNEGLEATSLLTLVHMVESGMGVALVPKLALDGGLIEGMDLVSRRLTSPVPLRTLAIAARRSTARAQEMDVIAQCATELHQRARGTDAPRGRGSRRRSNS